MRHVTREFAHAETLERAKRWLVEIGFHPSKIEVHTHGSFRITVAVESGEADEVDRVLDAVAAGDPDRAPGFWDAAKPHQAEPNQAHTVVPGAGTLPSETFDIGWRPLDPDLEVTQTSTENEKQKLYREERD